MFKSEREMQDTFVSLLKERKTCGLIFEEVGNRNFFFRTDIIEYKDRTNIIGYELKLDDFKKVIEQTIKTLELFDKSYVVIPWNKREGFIKVFKNFTDEKKEKIGIIIVNRDEYRCIKLPSRETTRNYNNKWNVGLIQDLIIRGYHKDGQHHCITYK